MILFLLTCKLTSLNEKQTYSLWFWFFHINRSPFCGMALDYILWMLKNFSSMYKNLASVFRRRCMHYTLRTSIPFSQNITTLLVLHVPVCLPSLMPRIFLFYIFLLHSFTSLFLAFLNILIFSMFLINCISLKFVLLSLWESLLLINWAHLY